jgi:LmbE family N-acetylglucosaminyl deacetylase
MIKKLWILLGLYSLTTMVWSQSRPASELLEEIKKLKVVGSVLYVAAHPDDENTRLISYLSNELKLSTSYVSLTRGDGGQNLIGPQLDELLGVIRTNELIQARKIDGGEQYFTRANDFGYSKTAEETFSIWSRDSVLQDLVRLIRTIKPDVIINRFDHRTSGKTHGHHTASAILALEAFDQARNSLYQREKFKDLEPVRVSRIFFNTSWFFWGSKDKFDQADKSHLHALDIGSYFPASGVSNGEVSARSRSMHKSQGFGINSIRGSQMEYFERLDDKKQNGELSPFDGLNLTWSRFNGGGNVEKIIDEIIHTFDVNHPEKSIPLLQKAETYIMDINAGHWKEAKLRDIRNLILECAGIYAEAYTDQQTVSAGDSLKIQTEMISRLSSDVVLNSVEIPELNLVFTHNSKLIVNVPVYYNSKAMVNRIRPTAPFWLMKGRGKGMYEVEDPEWVNKPATPASLDCIFKCEINGKPYEWKREVIYKNDDPVAGEIRQPLVTLPALTMNPSDELVILSKSEKTVLFEFELEAHRPDIREKIRVQTSPGIKVEPSEFMAEFNHKGEKKKFKVWVSTSEMSSRKSELKLNAGSEEIFVHHKIRYPHIPWQDVLLPARIKISVADIRIVSKRVAYVEGAGDYLDEAIRKMGFSCQVIPASKLQDLRKSEFDVLVFGIRALNTAEELKDCRRYIERFAEEGGKVIFQYNTSQELVTQDFLGEDFKISRSRVTNENSPVRILNPDHPVFQKPNKIIPGDFDHWVQERGLYFPGAYNSSFEELLEFEDPGEKPLKSGLLVMKKGKGSIIYSSLAWFRQMPSGVPGAYRILANLISY